MIDDGDRIVSANLNGVIVNREAESQLWSAVEAAKAHPGHVYDQWGREMNPGEVEKAHVALKRSTAAVRGHRCEACDSIESGVSRCAAGIALGDAHLAAIRRMREAVLK